MSPRYWRAALMAEERSRWREDFPVRWDEDNYMTRRELAKVPRARLGPAGGRQRVDCIHRADTPDACGSGPANRCRQRRRAGRLAVVPLSLPTMTRAFWCGTRRDGSRVLAGVHPPLVRRHPPARRRCAGLPLPQGIVLRARRAPAGGAADAAPAAHCDRAARRRSRGDGHRGVAWKPGSRAPSFSRPSSSSSPARGDPVVARRRSARRAVCATVRRPGADGDRVGDAVRVERRIALVRRVVRRAPPPVGPAWLTARRSTAARGVHSPEVDAEPCRATPDHPPVDPLFGAPDLGAVHVSERLHHDRAPRGGRDGVTHAVRVSLAGADGVSLLLHAARAGRESTRTRSTVTRSASCAGTAPCGCSACSTRRRRWPPASRPRASVPRRCRWHRLAR